MRRRLSRLPRGLGLALAAALAAALAPAGARADEQPASAPAPRGPRANLVDGRVDVTNTTAFDNQTVRHGEYTDFRSNVDATKLFGADLGLHLDLRGRAAWDDVTQNRFTAREAYVVLNEDAGAWRLAVGRQLVRPVASAGVDGARVDRRLGERAAVFVFGGLLPHPITEDFNKDFTGGGAGYEYRSPTSNHGGGVAFQLYRGGLDRLYLTQQSYVRLTRDLSIAAFALVDVVAPNGLIAVSGDHSRNLDLTSGYALVHYRPFRWLDLALSVNHNHTILPSKWWHDWLAARRYQIGFVLDGENPVGTRLTNLRWTANVPVTPTIVPYVQLRLDWRHEPDPAKGYEAQAGLKWRPAWAFVDVSYTFREYFSSQNHLGSLRLGGERTWGGVEADATVLQSHPFATGSDSTCWDLGATAWLTLSGLFGTRQRSIIMVQYESFIEPAITLHVIMVQLGYRF